MQSTTRPDWFQTVPLTRAIDPEFDIVEYFGELQIDEDGVDSVSQICKLSKLARQRAKKGMNAFTNDRKLEAYKQLIADLSRHTYYDAEAVELNNKIDEIDDTGSGNFWELLGSYKGFQILANIEGGEILVSQPEGLCFQTKDGWGRFCEIPANELQDVAFADAQEFIDAFVLSVLAIGQLSLPI